jgi:hypothetical protein
MINVYACFTYIYENTFILYKKMVKLSERISGTRDVLH